MLGEFSQGTAMRFLRKTLVKALVFGSSISLSMAPAGCETPENHVSAAKAAAGQEHLGLLARVCTDPDPAPAAPAAGNAQPRRTGPPPASEWHVEPAKVFDNLYF